MGWGNSQYYVDTTGHSKGEFLQGNLVFVTRIDEFRLEHTLQCKPNQKAGVCHYRNQRGTNKQAVLRILLLPTAFNNTSPDQDPNTRPACTLI